MPNRPPRYRAADTAQQLIGGFLLAGPFVVTEEVWMLAVRMGWLNGLGTAAVVVTIGYTALYGADAKRDPEIESDLGGVPLRFVSLLAVAFGSVILLVVLFDAPSTFFAALDVPPEQRPGTLFRVICVGSVFSVVGAATADSVF
ncbi:DUF2391 domain-containing protein [Halocatena halophila]|uniref:DUF2391 domain-containing protein n=1 Tax=Halocatena halophila TaxID=2814576 RepID=UPI002ED3BA88